MARHAQHLFPLVTLGAALALAACGGGSSSSGSSSSGAGGSTVSGVAAQGAPIAGATVTLKDAAGHSATGTTGSDGSFSISVDGLTAPFLLSVAAVSGSNDVTFYSYAGAANSTANLDAVGTLALQSYYTALGSSVTAAFSGSLGASSFPVAQQLNLLIQPLVNTLQPYLSNAGVTQPGQYNPLTTPFTANHTGIDRVLDHLNLGTSLLTFTVDNGTTGTTGPVSTTITVTTTPGSGSTLPQVMLTSVSADSGSDTGSGSVQSIPVGGNLTQEDDLVSAETGLQTLFTSLHALAVSKGSSLAASDVLPFIDSGYLEQGQNASAFASQIVSFLGSTRSASSFTVTPLRINNFADTASNPTIDVTLQIAITPGSGPVQYQYLDSNDNPAYGMVFRKQNSGLWAFYGHQSIADAHIDLTETAFNDPNNNTTVTNTLDMQAQVNVAVGTLTSSSTAVVLTGPSNSLPDCPGSGGSSLDLASVDLMHDSGTYNGDDRYDLPCTFTNSGALAGQPPAAGTAYNFALTKANSTVVNQAYALNSATTDNGVLTTINGTARATFAGATQVSSLAGTQVTLSYTPPTTYPVLYSFISAFCQNSSEVSGGGGTDIQGDASNIPAGTETGTITIPSQCDSAAPAGLALSVYFIGFNGERSQITQNILH